ncbi:signal peptide protein [Rhodococcus rhodochrous KG-21]|uniref:Signal peptide protein n=1 Tax=Rhodococcus rhodochrous KG-21 TaxID=1441923 RepID=A0A0M9WQ44_RHORH|nr:signal peptide protein [Rhodococcus rhodochrous KG-21]
MGIPDVVETDLGTFRFDDGMPDPETMALSWDRLDLLRGVDVFLNAVPGASLVAMRTGFRSIGIRTSREMAVCPRMDSVPCFLTANTETTYGIAVLDLRADGPTVVECPPMSLDVVDDFWFRYVADLGNAGPDKGRGGKYLLLPPGYEGEVPEGYFTYRSRTFTNFLFARNLGGLNVIEQTRIYPLAQADDPPEMRFVEADGVPFNTVHSNDFSFYEEVDQIVQEEPVDALDPELAGQLAAIGILKGRSFAPDERMHAILSQAAPIGSAIARTIVYRPRDPQAYLYGRDVSSWKTAFVGGSSEFLRDGVRLLDARTLFHYAATVVTPAMATPMVGVGSQYAYTAEDAEGEWLDGGRTYRMHLPAGIPAKDFWSVCVYDCQSRSLLQTDDPYPSLNSNTGTVAAGEDGSVDVYFGPASPAGRESNWIRTVSGKGWFVLLRLYGPLQAWFDRTWRPGEIEPLG